MILPAKQVSYASLQADLVRPPKSATERLEVHAQRDVHHHRSRSSLDCERGQASVEMVISLLVVMSLVFWVFEVCMFIYTCSVLNDATEEGVRYAIVHGTGSTLCSGPDTVCTNQAPYSNVQAAVKAAASASLHNISAMTVSVTYANNTAAVGNPVAVKVSYDYIPYVHITGLTGTISFSSRGNIVY